MDHIKEPDLEWLRSQRPDERSRGLFALYAEVNLDGWVCREGVMTRECFGGEEGGRVRTLHGVPYAFCLSNAVSRLLHQMMTFLWLRLAQTHSELVAEVVASWIVPSIQAQKNCGDPGNMLKLLQRWSQ